MLHFSIETVSVLACLSWTSCDKCDCKGFAVVTFAALVADVVLVDEAAVVVPHR